MTQEKFTEIRALQEQLDELDFDKGFLEARLRTLKDTDADGTAIEVPNDIGASSGIQSDVVNGIYLGGRPLTVGGQIEVYRRVVAARTGRLPLRAATGASGRGLQNASMLSLSRLYVGLDTDLSAPDSVVAAALKAARRGEFWPFPLPRERHLKEADARGVRMVTLMEAAILRRSQVLLGASGSGKTTFVNFLAHALATGDLKCLEGWPASERDYLPILVSLRDFAAWIGAHTASQPPSASLLSGFVLRDLRERNLSFAVEPLQGALERGEALLLLDGLDEVPAAALQSVRESIQDCSIRYASCRSLVTCRALAYEHPDRQLSERRFPKTRLRPFDRQQIERFIDAWSATNTGNGPTDAAPAREKARALRTAVQRPDLLRMSSNPMQLTVMALVHGCRGELPESRARLYEEAVGILLWHWESEGPDGELGLSDLLHQARRDRGDLIELLECLSYEICAGGDVGARIVYEERGLVAGIGEQDLVKALRHLHPRKRLDWAQAVADTLKLRTGLMVEKQPGVFRFLHRTFQEYLAGAHLAHFLDFPERAAELVPKWAGWREIILQAVGFLIHNQREVARPLLLVERLCPPQAPSDDAGGRRIWLAGEVLLEIGLSRVRDTTRGVRLLEQVSHRLAAIVERGALQVPERAQVGDVLGVLADPRFDKTRFHLPASFRGEREKAIGLVIVESGAFSMGSRDDDRDAQRDEVGNISTVTVDYRYWIARYPVTVGAFAGFIRAGGYDSADWWTAAGFKWCRDRVRREPDGWSEQAAFTNRPVVGVSWFEAAAYTRWLDVQLRRRAGDVPENYLMRLPTEAEWEKAARGFLGRRYAWGDDWDGGRANAADSVGRAATVGMFPDGETPAGIQDLSGNVREWCLSAYRPYPYKADDGRNAADAPGMRVLRGGSWSQGPGSARCACRCARLPDISRQDAGFRLVLSVAGALC